MSTEELESRAMLRGLMVGLSLVAPFWAAVAWAVTR